MAAGAADKYRRLTFRPKDHRSHSPNAHEPECSIQPAQNDTILLRVLLAYDIFVAFNAPDLADGRGQWLELLDSQAV